MNNPKKRLPLDFPADRRPYRLAPRRLNKNTSAAATHSGREISLIAAARKYRPPCAQISPNSSAITKARGFVILWKKLAETSIENLIIAHKFNSGAGIIKRDRQNL